MQSVIHSVCVQDCCKSNQPISLKFVVMIWPTDRKNWLTFGGYLVQDTDSGSLFDFPHRCRIGILGDLLAIQSLADFHDSRRDD